MQGIYSVNLAPTFYERSAYELWRTCGAKSVSVSISSRRRQEWRFGLGRWLGPCRFYLIQSQIDYDSGEKTVTLWTPYCIQWQVNVRVDLVRLVVRATKDNVCVCYSRVHGRRASPQLPVGGLLMDGVGGRCGPPGDPQRDPLHYHRRLDHDCVSYRLSQSDVLAHMSRYYKSYLKTRLHFPTILKFPKVEKKLLLLMYS